MLLPFQGGINNLPYTQGDCPGLTASGPSGRSPYLRSVSLVFTLFHFDTLSSFYRLKMKNKRWKIKMNKINIAYPTKTTIFALKTY